MQDSDAAVLAALREYGPGTVTVKQVAEMAGVPRVTARVAVAYLALDGLICLIPDVHEIGYMIRHLHAEPGTCEESLGVTVQEVHPDGQH
jgi:MarR family